MNETPTTNDELFAKYAALWAKVDNAPKTETWADKVDDSPIRLSNKR
jgi:hypothetical protein